MQIKTLKLKNFRNYTDAVVNFSSGINFLVGKNAQGKTNLLESLYLLSVGRSPKHSKDKQIIKFDSEISMVELDFNTNSGKKKIKLILDKQNKKSIQINGYNVFKITELVGVLSVVYFSPDELRLIKDVPEDRRTFLDISISQFDKNYLYNLIKYDKILKQRNVILKSNESDESKIEQLKLFTPQLIDVAEKIIEKRLKFIKNINNIAKNIHKTITLTENLEILYGYNKDFNLTIKQDLQNKFEENVQKELELGYTCFGPHRDDMIFKIDGLDCKYYASQGQQRTVALVVKLALMEVIKNEINEYPVLLLDDVLSELDSERQDRMLKLTSKYQTIISCTNVPKNFSNLNIININNGKIV